MKYEDNPIEFKAEKIECNTIIIQGDNPPLVITLHPNLPESAVEVIVNRLNGIFDQPRRWAEHQAELQSNPVVLTQEPPHIAMLDAVINETRSLRLANSDNDSESKWKWKCQWCHDNKVESHLWDGYNVKAEHAHKAHFGPMASEDSQPSQSDATEASWGKRTPNGEWENGDSGASEAQEMSKAMDDSLTEWANHFSNDPGLQSNQAQQLINEGAIEPDWTETDEEVEWLDSKR